MAQELRRGAQAISDDQGHGLERSKKSRRVKPLGRAKRLTMSGYLRRQRKI
jgi:hypothetical protein